MRDVDNRNHRPVSSTWQSLISRPTGTDPVFRANLRIAGYPPGNGEENGDA
jgi:hypothetical protein